MGNKSDRMHAFWLGQLEEAATGLAEEGDEWSASLLQRARGYARVRPVADVDTDHQRLDDLRVALRRQQGNGSGSIAAAASKALALLADADTGSRQTAR